MMIDLMRDSAKTFPRVEHPESVLALRIWYCKYSDLSPLRDFVNLEELSIAGFTDKSFENLASLAKLRYLKILHPSRIQNLHGLEQLRNLEQLSLATNPSWDASRKYAVVESFAEVAQLPKLRRLELFGIHARDSSLEPLRAITTLKSASVSGYPKNDMDKFYADTGLSDEHLDKSSFD